MSRRLLFISLFLLPVLFSGCRRGVAPGETVDADHLVYHIKYLEDRAGDVPTAILPAKMDAYYTRYHVLTRIDGFFNQFSLVQVADLRRRRVTTLLNFFGNKVYYESEPGQMPAAIVEPVHLEYRATGDTAVIGGLNSEEMMVEADDESYSIYFTRDFRVRRPNISTPYYMVEDPLTDFRIQLSYLKMHLTCTGMEHRTVESGMFLIPEDYKPVNRSTMEEIINSLFTND
jgi:hypothetical protein